MLGVSCNSCGAPLTPGAHFCHRCGAAAGAAGAVRAVGGQAPVAATGQRSIVPWIVAGAGALALVILVAAQQGKGSAPAGSDLGGGAPLATGAVRAPDISTMSPRERVDRLYDRVMRLVEEGKSDSAAFFSSMAVGAYADLGPLDNDLRYDFGRMADVAGELDVAKAQSDSILQSNPDHLLGLALAARVAERRGNVQEQRRFLDRLVAARSAQMAKNLDEYVRHRADIEAAVKARQ